MVWTRINMDQNLVIKLITYNYKTYLWIYTKQA
jgi:hypothetical protein